MTPPSQRYSSWIRTFHSTREAGIRLVCFPHAGGGAGFYFPLSGLLPPEVQLLAVQYPGRQDRRNEPGIGDIGTLADRIADALQLRHGGDRLAFFGHSMGAAVAFETARRLEQHPGSSPVHLFVSGRPAPCAHDQRPEQYLHLRDDEELIAELSMLSGTDPALFSTPELRELLLSPVRADFRAIETYRCTPGASVGCPITALTGNADPLVSPAQVRMWQAHTSASCTLHVYEGRHFYLAERFGEVADQICRTLKEYL